MKIYCASLKLSARLKPKVFHLPKIMKKITSAFTLVELLVVIAIIALLASIAFPAYQKAMERAHSIADLANLRSLGTGAIMFLNDNNNVMFTQLDWPAGNANTSGSGGGNTDPSLYNKYIDNLKVFQSPFDRRNTGGLTTPNMPVSYGINTNLMVTNSSASNANAFNGNMENLDSPSYTIMMAPAYKAGSDPSDPSTWQGKASKATKLLVGNGGSKNSFWGTHSGRKQIDVLFCDGHVASIGWSDFVTDGGDVNTPADFYRWKPVNPSGN